MKARYAVAVTALATITGCAAMRENQTMCKVVTSGTGALLGATAGGLISGVAAEHGDSGGSKNWEIGLATGGGAAAGGLIGLLIGNAVCPEPPPPPPPVTKAPPPPPAPATRIASIPGAQFEFNKSNLTAEGRRNVAGAAAVLKQQPNVRVYVDGHTDSVGSSAYNMTLGERRARSVASALADEGISPSRMTTRSFGEQNPVASNETAAGRAENRRAEVVVR